MVSFFITTCQLHSYHYCLFPHGMLKRKRKNYSISELKLLIRAICSPRFVWYSSMWKVNRIKPGRNFFFQKKFIIRKRDSAPDILLSFLDGVGGGDPFPEREIALWLHCLNLGLGLWGSFRLGAISLLTQTLSLLIISNDSSNYFQSLFKGRAGGWSIKLPMWTSHGATAIRAGPWSPQTLAWSLSGVLHNCMTLSRLLHLPNLLFLDSNNSHNVIVCTRVWEN